ncbi:hypothetical protein ACGFZK_33300 [Streptomyces sp. NPDC048257]|uniref:hypothetical protein n=1 Tax=Streptomyces sp. NPDC048257 TaxID=3365526 RepID=UPI00371AA848
MARTSSAYPPVVADLSRLGAAAALIDVLGRRRHDFLVFVPPTLAVRAAGLAQGGDATAADFARLGNTSHPYTTPRIHSVRRTRSTATGCSANDGRGGGWAGRSGSPI